MIQRNIVKKRNVILISSITDAVDSTKNVPDYFVAIALTLQSFCFS